MRFPRLALLLAILLAAVSLPAQITTTMPTSGQPVPSLAQLDTIMQQYMTQYNAPGANLSVSVDGRLVFARGYGYANTTTGEFVQPDSRMRLASNSKIITAVGILKLIEQGKLSLTTTPFTSILAGLTPPPGTTVDPRIASITISELLQHTAGYDDGSGYPFDPVNDYPTNRAAAANAGLTGQACTPAALISYELGVALQHNPGSTYAYSNLGYLTLGYIIEKVTGVPYATWIEQNIFPTAKMTQTLPAGNLMTDKLPYEVAYYGQEGNNPSFVPPVGVSVPYEYGGLDLVLELANGGWTSTPMDLLRFWDTLNGQYSYNILQNGQSTRVGDVPPLGQGYYYTFYGSLPGTNSLVHLNTSSQVVGRVVYSAIFNTRSGSNLEEPESDADNAIQAYVQTVKAWPTGDLFPNYATAGTACAFTLATTSATAPMAGNTGTVAVTDANYCAYTGTANATWLHVNAATNIFNTNGTLTYVVDANTGAARTGTITIAGQTFTVNQSGTTTPTTLALTGSGTLSGSTETVTLTATLSPYNASGVSTDGELITFANGGQNGDLYGTAKLLNGVAMFTGNVVNRQINDFNAYFPGDTNFGQSYSAHIMITPSSTSATVSPTSLTFPATPTGTTSAVMTSTFTNTGTTAYGIDLLSVTGPFTESDTCKGIIAAGASCTISVAYKPTTVGTNTGNVTLSDNAGNQVITLSGTATAAAPVVTLTPTSLTFPSTTVNTSSAAMPITVTNTGNAPLAITNVAALSGNNQFTQTNNCTGAAIAANASCTVNVTFSPTATGTLTASIVLTDNASPTQQTIPLSGTAVAGPAPVATFTPTALTFPSTQVSTTSAAMTTTLTNTGTATLNLGDRSTSGDFAYAGTTCGTTVAVNASCTFTFTFTPTAIGARTGSFLLGTNAGSQTVLLMGTGAAFSAPAITLSGTPTSITYGQSVMLTASATGAQTAGNYTWSILDGTTVITAAQPYTATFGYTVVNPVAGSHSYTAVLTSTSATTYPTGTSNAVAITVAKATTASTYTMPAAITYGTPLTTTQLDATSTTPGTFTYTPAAGTILTAGTQPLSATLTPTDATDYSASTASTSIVINKASLTATAANATRPYGAANPTLTGSITGALASDAITATFTSTATPTALAGSTAPITPTLADPNNRLPNYNVTLTPAVLTITQAGSIATLTGPASTPAGSAATLTATITSTTTGIPTGMVTLSTGASAMLVNGVATFTFTPPVGSTVITLNYAGDNNFLASTGSLTVTTGIPAFSVTATPTSATVSAGSAASFTLMNAGINGFNQTIFFSCAGLPANSSCNFAPAIVTPGQPSQLTITTASGVVGQNQPTHPSNKAEQVAVTFLAFLIGLPLLRRPRSWTSSALRRSLLSLFLLLGLTAGLIGCGSNNNFVNQALNTPKGTYTVTVNALTTGAAAHTTTLTLTVQ